MDSPFLFSALILQLNHFIKYVIKIKISAFYGDNLI